MKIPESEQSVLLLPVLLSCLLLFSTACTSTRNSTDPTPAKVGTTLSPKELNFPEDWQGAWSGNLEIYTLTGLAQQVPMQLEIYPIDSSENWTWNIVYGPDRETGLRAYELVPVDPEKGLYAIDEQNSIRLEAYLLGGQLVQRFEVMGNLLVTTTQLIKPNTLRWEILSGKLDPVSTTGDQVVEGDTIPPVRGYPVGVRQTATLKRD